MSNHAAECNAIIQGSVRSQAKTFFKSTESALQLLTLGAVCGTKHVQSVYIDPTGHHARTDARAHCLAQQERKIELHAVVGDDKDVLVWLHRSGHVLLVLRIVLGIKDAERCMS